MSSAHERLRKDEASARKLEDRSNDLMRRGKSQGSGDDDNDNDDDSDDDEEEEEEEEEDPLPPYSRHEAKPSTEVKGVAGSAQDGAVLTKGLAGDLQQLTVKDIRNTKASECVHCILVCCW